MYLSVYLCKKKYRNDKLESNKIGYPQGVEGMRWKGLERKNTSLYSFDFESMLMF